MQDENAPASPAVIPIQSIEKLADALAKAQGEFPPIPKDSEVEVKSKEGKLLYKYKYADLTTIIACTRPAMSKNGLSFTQGVVAGGFVTTFLHSSGQTLKTGFIPCEIPRSADMKQVGGLITYVKRISLTAALGVSADEDVDAAAVEGSQGNSTAKAPAKNQPAAKAEQKAPPANFAPASPASMEMITNLAIDRQLPESALLRLLNDGYGIKGNKPPEWIAKEMIKMLENEDCTLEKINSEIPRIATRRATAAIKGGAK